MILPEAGVLFVGEYPGLSASVARILNSLGCEHRYVATCQEALAALRQRRFRVVLSKAKLADGNPRELIPALQAASGWLFLSFPVEDGCWWIPIMQDGQLCVEAVALHSREFSKSLLKIMKSILPAPRELAAESSARVLEFRRRAVAAGSY
jgi:hypothetical protein